MFKRFAHITLALSLIVSTIALGWVPAKADISSCSSSVTPHSVEPDSTTDFSFQLTNTDPNPIHWIRITRPSSNFTITANSAPGWQSTTSSRFAFQTNGTLNSGQTLTITVTASAGSTEIPSENWKVEASEDPGVNIVS